MKKKENNRTCIVTRTALNRDQLIRFVVGPNDNVVVDLKEKLPGRGVWVTNNLSTVQKARERNMFASAFKSKVNVSEDISREIENLMLGDISQGLSFARKSGLVITGFSKVDAMARKGEIKVIFHASDGTSDGLDKIRSALKVGEIAGGYKKGIPKVFDQMSSAQLDQALGMTNTVHVALAAGGTTTSLKTKIARIVKYRE